MLKYRYRSLLCKYNRLLVLSFLMVCRYHRRVSWAPLSLLLSCSLFLFLFPLSLSTYFNEKQVRVSTRPFLLLLLFFYLFASFVFFFFINMRVSMYLFSTFLHLLVFNVVFHFFAFFSFAFTLYASRAYNINYFTLFVLLTPSAQRRLIDFA